MNKTTRKLYRPFSPAFFSKGTSVEVRDANNRRIVFTVDKLHKTSPDHFLITSKEPELTDAAAAMTYGINNVTKILERAPGVAVLDDEDKNNYFKVIQDEERFKVLKFVHVKHSSQYAAASVSDLIMLVSDKYIRDDEVVDHEKLVDSVIATNIFKLHHTGDYLDDVTFFVANKKKLHQVIKRLVPKCKMKVRTAQKEMDKMFDEAWANAPAPRYDMEDLFATVNKEYRVLHSSDIPEGSDARKIFDEIFNLPSLDHLLRAGLSDELTQLSNVSEIPGIEDQGLAAEGALKLPNKPTSLSEILEDMLAKIELIQKHTRSGVAALRDEANRMTLERIEATIRENTPKEEDIIAKLEDISCVPEEVRKCYFWTREEGWKRIPGTEGKRWNKETQTLEDAEDPAIIEKMLDDDELLSDSITYVDNGETDDGNFTPDPNK
jgi:hypothetical protein